MNYFQVTLPSGKTLSVPEGSTLLSVIQDSRETAPPVLSPEEEGIGASANEALSVRADCGGSGTCGKCWVLANGQRVLACRTRVDRDMVLATDPAASGLDPGRDVILTSAETGPLSGTTESLGTKESAGKKECAGKKERAGKKEETLPRQKDAVLKAAVDIGTTTMAIYLTEEDGHILTARGRRNPQGIYGADVIARIRRALSDPNAEKAMTLLVRQEIDRAVEEMRQEQNLTAEQIRRVTVVGNPAMQQLFMGLPLNNLVELPYHPILTAFETVPAGPYLASCPEAELRVIPDIGAYVGADLLAAALQAGLDLGEEEAVLLVDIGTNGEMMLAVRKPDGSREYRCCATAAGPAFEGAGILCGMRAAEGAIDRVIWKDGALRVHVIGEEKGAEAIGLCGTGLMDAVACFLQAGLIDKRGRILSGEPEIFLAGEVRVTQEDIRCLQSAKAAIAAGIRRLLKESGYPRKLQVLLAGAFGSSIRVESALRIGLLPFGGGTTLAEMAGPAGVGAGETSVTEIRSIGNAAGVGAVSFDGFGDRAGQMMKKATLLELGSHPDFRKLFGESMYFTQEEHHG